MKKKFLGSQFSGLSSEYVIGLNSGTSFDGIDVALVKFQEGLLVPKFIDGLVYEYPRSVKERIRNANKLSINEISQLNFLLGELFADAAIKIIKKNKLKPKDILLIGSHGQTIFHDPGKSTLQIGEPSVIAQRTGIKTISNFREADIAVGGQGAPLMPFLDWVIFGRGALQRALLNIGGISNITIVGKGVARNALTPIAFDIGPGNALIDLVSQKYFKKDFDKDGKLAAKGEINFKLVDKALKDPYFKKRPPKSTGKEYFNERFIKKYFSKIVGAYRGTPLISTLTYFTAKTIAHSLKKYDVKEIVISGGGIKNKTLISHLRKLLPNQKFTISDKYGLPWKYKEAMLFALLGYTCYKNIPNNIPSCTGARKKVVMGKMI